MAKRNAIISELFVSDWYNEALKTIVHPFDIDDLNQEVMVVLLSKPEEDINRLYKSDYFRWYVVRVIMNIYRMPKSKFVTENNKYISMPDSVKAKLDSMSDSDFDALIEDNRLHELKLQATNDVIENLYWYDREIFKLWMANTNAKKIARDTMISHREILRVITEVKTKIRNRFIELI
jgi:hypothetical protein